ncbi:MAG: ABC transporter superfamily protein [Amphiamblys sp. WSBS2006]|nr:MAG: ABC transporter superfamily protein [Amphiamblys sp. WSBS2006]
MLSRVMKKKKRIASHVLMDMLGSLSTVGCYFLIEKNEGRLVIQLLYLVLSTVSLQSHFIKKIDLAVRRKKKKVRRVFNSVGGREKGRRFIYQALTDDRRLSSNSEVISLAIKTAIAAAVFIWYTGVQNMFWLYLLLALLLVFEVVIPRDSSETRKAKRLSLIIRKSVGRFKKKRWLIRKTPIGEYTMRQLNRFLEERRETQKRIEIDMLFRRRLWHWFLVVLSAVDLFWKENLSGKTHRERLLIVWSYCRMSVAATQLIEKCRAVVFGRRRRGKKTRTREWFAGLKTERGQTVRMRKKTPSDRRLFRALSMEYRAKGTVLGQSGRVSCFIGQIYTQRTVRENIVGDEEFDVRRYHRVLEITSIGYGLSAIGKSDRDDVGGISSNVLKLIPLGRCIYKQADIYIFNDPFENVSDKYLWKVLRAVFFGFLDGKTRILYTAREIEDRCFDLVIDEKCRRLGVRRRHRGELSAVIKRSEIEETGKPLLQVFSDGYFFNRRKGDIVAEVLKRKEEFGSFLYFLCFVFLGGFFFTQWRSYLVRSSVGFVLAGLLFVFRRYFSVPPEEKATEITWQNISSVLRCVYFTENRLGSWLWGVSKDPPRKRPVRYYFSVVHCVEECLLTGLFAPGLWIAVFVIAAVIAIVVFPSTVTGKEKEKIRGTLRSSFHEYYVADQIYIESRMFTCDAERKRLYRLFRGHMKTIFRNNNLVRMLKHTFLFRILWLYLLSGIVVSSVLQVFFSSEIVTVGTVFIGQHVLVRAAWAIAHGCVLFIEAEEDVETKTGKEREERGEAHLTAVKSIEFKDLFVEKNKKLMFRGVDLKIDQEMSILFRGNIEMDLFLDILFGEKRPLSGEIRVNDIRLETISRESLHDQFGIFTDGPVFSVMRLRKFLDPADQYSDDVLWRVLGYVSLDRFLRRQRITLGSVIDAEENVFSPMKYFLLQVAFFSLHQPSVLILPELDKTAWIERTVQLSLLRRFFPQCILLLLLTSSRGVVNSPRFCYFLSGRIVEEGCPSMFAQRRRSFLYRVIKSAKKDTRR